MRPDPYKRERSRRYLAKQRTKSGDKKTARAEPSTSALVPAPPPSNAGRYLEEDAGASDSDSDSYDIASAAQLESLLQGITIDAESGSGEEPCRPRETKDPSEDRTSFYAKFTSLDPRRLAVVIEKEPATTEAELAGLPDWFQRHCRECAGGRGSEREGGGGAKGAARIGEGVRKLQAERRRRDTVAPARDAVVSEAAAGLRGTAERLELEDWLDDVIK